uniref:Chitin-binding type-2 domain-containing protein n=1 Tax=Heterorhabditis bacteriophora TaxID=37862 RepID=A0A1I7XJM4_HETBA
MREVYVYLVLGALVSSEISEVKIDCARGDGFYVIGCNTEFHRCHEGNPIRYECPVGLFFNPRRSKCDYKEEITECNHRISVANVIKASGMFSCANRTDGSYSHPDNPCDTQYFTCSYGRLTPQVCPYNQWFNEQMKRCDYKENVGACNMVTGKMK